MAWAVVSTLFSFQSLAVLLYESSSLLAGFRSFLRSFFRDAGCGLGGACRRPCFGGGILAFDCLPLLEFGIGVAGRVIQVHFLLQSIQIGFVQLLFHLCCFSVRFQFVAPVASPPDLKSTSWL